MVIAERSQSGKVAVVCHHRAPPQASMLLSGFCSLLVREPVTQRLRDGIYSFGLPGICFKSDLPNAALGQTEGSRPYALNITFTVREKFSGPWPILRPRMSTAIGVPISMNRSYSQTWHTQLARIATRKVSMPPRKFVTLRQTQGRSEITTARARISWQLQT